MHGSVQCPFLEVSEREEPRCGCVCTVGAPWFDGEGARPGRHLCVGKCGKHSCFLVSLCGLRNLLTILQRNCWKIHNIFGLQIFNLSIYLFCLGD